MLDNNVLHQEIFVRYKIKISSKIARTLSQEVKNEKSCAHFNVSLGNDRNVNLISKSSK